jgi:hypothetical protein
LVQRWILNNDNAPAHKVLSVKQFLAQISITEMEHPPHSLDLPSSQLLAVSKNKICLKGRKISGYCRQPTNVMTLKAIPQYEFQKRFQQSQHRWAKCIALGTRVCLQ